jgi:pyruvate,water dikinase
MRRAERLAFSRAAREAHRRAEDCAADVVAAGDTGALERIYADARASAEGISAVARMLSAPDGGAAAAARVCRDAARGRAKSRAGKSAAFASAAAAGGAQRPEGVELPENAWRSFVESNGLDEWLARTLDDASLGLRRKSERVRERVMAGKLDAASAAGAAALAAAAGGALVVGEDAALKSEGPADVLERVRETWAASWSPGPLGRRLRAGRGLAYEGRVRVEKALKAETSGLVFSRDPGSGRRERILVEAAMGPIESVLAGDGDIESYALDRRSGREIAPRSGSGDSVLSTERLAQVARLARALDAWKASGVEVAFSFVGGRLIAHHARSLEPPRAPLPSGALSAPRPEAQFLNVRPVAR